MKEGRYELVPIDEIHLDLKNPRIAKWVDIYGDEIPAEQIALALGAGSGQEDQRGPSFLSLQQSIRTNGGIIHPIIVNRESNGRLVVIEGNTRTKIFLEFIEQGVEGNWHRIPAMVYDNLDAGDIDAIRLQAHLVGTREWDPYSKAKYLDSLRNNEHLTFSQIVDYCGGDKHEVNNFLNAYQDMEKYYRPILDSDNDFDPTRFSAFVELQKSRVAEALLKTRFTKSDFSRWVHEKKVYPLNTVRRLPQILKSEKVLEIFLKYNAQEAIKVLDAPTQGESLGEASFNLLARELLKRINSIQYDELQRLRNDAEDEREIFFDARDALMNFCKDLESKE
jgi:hypothetical protein